MKRTETRPVLDRILTWSLNRPLPMLWRYLIASLLIATIAVLRAAFVTELLPWLLFIPAILGITLILGEGTGLYASALATLAAALTLGDGAQPLYLTGPQWAGSALFLLIAIALARVVGELRASFRRARTLNTELSEREAFTSSVLASSTDCIKVIDLDGRLAFMSEGGMKVMEVSDFNDVKGCPWPDFWQDAGNAEARNALARARTGLTSHFTGKANTFAGTPRWWDVSVSPILGPDNQPDRILSVSRDMTEFRLDADRHVLDILLALLRSDDDCLKRASISSS